MLNGPRAALLPVYASMPVRPVRGRGSWLVDEDGDEWLDAYGGHAVASTGHSHPDVVRAIAEQAEPLLFYSTAVPLPAAGGAGRAAGRAVSRAARPGVPLQLGRGGQRERAAPRPAATPAARRSSRCAADGTAAPPRRSPAPTAPATRRPRAGRGMPLSRKVPFDDVAALDAAVDDTVAAVLVEPVQGFAGARDCSPEFLAAARRMCDERGAVLLFDEVQCGVGRCGAFSAAEAFGVTPDALTFAKGLAGGLPIGAVVASPALTDSLAPGDLGSTFGGGPVPCAAALANIGVIERDGLIANAVAVGEHLADGARALGVRQVSGRGLLLGLHLGRPAVEVQRALFGQRILTGTATDPQVLRLLPPLSFSHARGRPAPGRTQGGARVTKRDFLALEDWSPTRSRACSRSRPGSSGAR